ncbi:hypothetical protein [Roseateles sp.]|uniref:hypothetical protein n=1 Tax=Roseateles sp. TaxID=1971397 RepID=UPI0039648C4F
MLKTSLRIALIAAALGLTACSDSDVQTHGAGIQASDKTTLQDVGLPGYAGATPEKPMEGKEGNGGSFGAWAGKFGLQIHAMSFTSTDKPDQVAAFYAEALGRYGDVLDCRHPATREKTPEGEPERLRCDAKVPATGHYEFRAGTAKNFRVVHVEPRAEGTRFELVRIEIRGG